MPFIQKYSDWFDEISLYYWIYNTLDDPKRFILTFPIQGQPEWIQSSCKQHQGYHDSDENNDVKWIQVDFIE